MNPTAPAQQVPPTSSTQQPIVITPETVAAGSNGPKVKISKKLMGILAVVLIAVAIPITLFVVSQRQTITQEAAPAARPQNAVAQVYSGYILSPELDSFVSATGMERAAALEMLIERKILDEESKRSGIGVTDPEVTARLAETGIENFENMRVFAKYDILKEKILKANVEYIEAEVISFWLPPTDYPVEVPAAKKQEVAIQRSLQKDVLASAEEKLAAKEDPVAIANALLVQYPSYKSILVLNGSNVSSATDEALRQPYIHILKKNDDKKTSLGILLEGMNEGEAKQLEHIDGSGGMVALVTSKHTGTFDSYDAWFNDKKTKFVKLF